MIAAQLVACHNAAMESYRRSMLSEQTFEGRQENLNQANKLSRTYALLLDSLNRHRGKGQQRKQRSPSADNFAAPEAFFLGRLHYNAVRGSVCGRVRVIANDKDLPSLAFEEVCDPAGQFLSGVFRYVNGIATSARTVPPCARKRQPHPC